MTCRQVSTLERFHGQNLPQSQERSDVIHDAPCFISPTKYIPRSPALDDSFHGNILLVVAFSLDAWAEHCRAESEERIYLV